jgi:hypothetical protein
MAITKKDCVEFLLVVAAVAGLLWLLSIQHDGYDSIPREPIEELRESVDFEPGEEDVEGLGVPRSPKWPAVRAEFVRLHPTCAACGSWSALNVHHVLPFHQRPDLELDPSNLITLCREHHFRIGHDPDGPWKPARPNWLEFNRNVRKDAAKWKTGL